MSAALPGHISVQNLEIKARRIHECEIECAEEIASSREKVLLHDVLQAARRERRRSFLLFLNQLLAESNP